MKVNFLTVCEDEGSEDVPCLVSAEFGSFGRGFPKLPRVLFPSRGRGRPNAFLAGSA